MTRRLLTALPKEHRDDVAYGASVAAKEQERQLAMTSIYQMYGGEMKI